MRTTIPAMTLLFALLCATKAPPVGAQTSTASKLRRETSSDFKYLVNNTADDAIDVVSAPLHVSAVGPLLTSPRFYLIVAGAGALWGGSFGLDQTMKSHLRSMSSSDADLLQNASYGGVSVAMAVRTGYGLYSG